MSKVHYGKCEYCKHDGTSYCEDCEHYEHEYYDHWEEATPEEVAEKEKTELENAVKNATSEYITLAISEDFKKAFDNAKRCAAQAHYRTYFMGVLMTQDGHMVSSDRYMLSKLRCDIIPEPLKGRIVVTLEDGKAGLNNGKFPDYEFLLDTAGHESIPLDQVEVTELSGVTNLRLDNSTAAVGSDKLQLAKEILQGEITLYYRKGTAPLILKGPSGLVVINPLRQSSSE